MKKTVLTVLIFIALLTPAASGFGGIAVITSNESPVSSLSKKEVRDIFLGHVTKWKNGKKIVIVIMNGGDSHIFFTRNILGIPPEKLARLWKRAFFSGSGNLPKICSSEERMIELVAKYPGAIGYISDTTPYSGVKRFLPE